jgi:hypothetical protein
VQRVQVRKLPVDHDKRAADLLELVQLTGLGDRCAAAAAAAAAAHNYHIDNHLKAVMSISSSTSRSKVSCHVLRSCVEARGQHQVHSRLTCSYKQQWRRSSSSSSAQLLRHKNIKAAAAVTADTHPDLVSYQAVYRLSGWAVYTRASHLSSTRSRITLLAPF